MARMLCGSLSMVGRQKEQNGCCKPGGVKDILANVDATAYGWHVKQDLACKARIQADAQELLEGGHWQPLGLEGTLIIMDRMVDLPCVDNLISVVQKCRKTRFLMNAKRVHAHIYNNALEAHRTLGNYIVPTLVECGSVSNAQQVFNRLLDRNERSWTSLILGYIQCGQTQHAFNLYQTMQEDDVHPSTYTHMAILKACARLKDLERGRESHVKVAQNGFEQNIFIGSTLVDMYSKCGSLSKAREVFDKLPLRNVVSWSALIAGYAERGHGQEALKCFEQMLLEGISPNFVTLVCVLKACRSIGAIDKGREIHAEMAEKGYVADVSVSNALIDLYAKCGSLLEAQEVFDELPVRDVVSWNTLIAGYAEHGFGLEALQCFEQMQLEHLFPDAVTFVSALKACASLEAIGKGRDLHAEIVQKGFEGDLFVSSTLVDMYAKCRSVAEAREVFDKLQVRNVVSWSSLIAGYAEHGPAQEALKCFEQMQFEGLSPNVVTFVCALKACGSIGTICKGREVHAKVVQKGFDGELFVGSTLVDMYAKCGSLLEAHEVFDNLSDRNAVSWNTLIAGYAEHGPGQEALECFEQMQVEGVPPNAVTFICVLKACSNIEAINMGREIHAEMARIGFERDLCVGSMLIAMYAKCVSMAEAQGVFDKLPARNVVSWNTLIAGYAEHAPSEEVLECFEQMQVKCISPTISTFTCVLRACGSIQALGKGRKVHADIARKGFGGDLFVANTLVDMYAKCGSLAEAQEVFDKLLDQDVVSWNALISGYAENGSEEEALKCFELMQLEGVSPNAVTFVCALKSCGSIGALCKAREVHAEIARKGVLEDIFVCSTLIDVYAKCGSLSEAQEVFIKLPVQNVWSWNAMIKGYGMNHEGNLAVQCFENMRKHNVNPDAITFTCLLAACSRTKLVFKGKEYFKLMREEYGITPKIEHYTCMVDLLARSGHLYEAEKFLETMQCPPSVETWTALLSACKTYGEAEVGLRCFQRLIQMDAGCAASYLLMENIYANAGRWDDVCKVEDLRQHVGAKKRPASALIELNKKVHEFMVGNPPESSEVSSMLEILSARTKGEGHVPNLDVVLRSCS